MAHEVREARAEGIRATGRRASPSTIDRTGPSSPRLVPIIRREPAPAWRSWRFEPSGSWRTLLLAVGLAAAMSLAFYCFLGSNVGGHRIVLHRR